MAAVLPLLQRQQPRQNGKMDTRWTSLTYVNRVKHIVNRRARFQENGKVSKLDQKLEIGKKRLWGVFAHQVDGFEWEEL